MKLRLIDVTFLYPGAAKPALRQCAMELDCSAITVLVGSNGAGKSTLIRLLTGQLAGFSGRYLLNDHEAETLRGEWLFRNRFGYVPDFPALDSLLTGLEVLRLAAGFRGIPQAQVGSEIERYATLFDMGSWLSDTQCGKYSKGMRKKVSLAIGFLGDPVYVFLDEPFDGLDPLAVLNLKRLLKERAARGLGCLLSSHMLDAAEKVADALILMKEGRPIYAGSFQGLLDSYPRAMSLEEIYFDHLTKTADEVR